MKQFYWCQLLAFGLLMSACKKESTNVKFNLETPAAIDAMSSQEFGKYVNSLPASQMKSAINEYYTAHSTEKNITNAKTKTKTIESANDQYDAEFYTTHDTSYAENGYIPPMTDYTFPYLIKTYTWIVAYSQTGAIWMTSTNTFSYSKHLGDLYYTIYEFRHVRYSLSSSIPSVGFLETSSDYYPQCSYTQPVTDISILQSHVVGSIVRSTASVPIDVYNAYFLDHQL